MNTSRLKDVPHACALRLQALYDGLKSAERRAADFVLDHAVEIGDLTIGEASIRAGCSEATFVRLARRLGYEGFHELKEDFAATEASPDTVEYETIARGDGPLLILQKVFDRTVTSISDTLQTVEREAFEHAVDLIVRANKLLFCGLGDGALVAMEAAQRFARAGHTVSAPTDPDLQLICASQLSEKDVLVGISHTGRSRTVLEAVKVASGQGSSVIAITNFPSSPLARRARVLLQTAAFSRVDYGEVISKRVTQLCLIEALYINYVMRKGPAATARLERSNDVLAVYKV
jgi:DNA-binding MurR/RpiR family transcriptional regulator